MRQRVGGERALVGAIDVPGAAAASDWYRLVGPNELGRIAAATLFS